MALAGLAVGSQLRAYARIIAASAAVAPLARVGLLRLAPTAVS
ncbi:hypothetical protein KIM372_16690 [Bombiscardovia nodaiensis]|uniref:Uncharacterized protein n=1 Tax=Bombiscardovia nodaiensis TaxID=2932181 RepID=A0ABN6SEW8_9BIFI|nr:hypothetical protein KIM372_16690 [Bombiscardovia nodaiensis]